jgi:anaerobic magnesium-protoporphyrin IX monomethyl ester cyclase
MKFLFVVEPLSYEWLGIMYVSAVLKKFGLETKLFVIGEDITNILEWQPDFVGYSVLTGSHRNLFKFNYELKQKLDFVSVFGGPHPTYFPQMVNETGVDYIVRGEAEESIEILLNRPKEKIIFAKLPQNLDLIPFPDRELIYSHLPTERKNPIRHFIASRGCPFDCPYCYNNAAKKLYPNQKWVRYRSVDNVIEEIQLVLSKYGGKFIYFQDDCFDLNKKWLFDFLRLYKQKIGLPFHCIIRLDLLDEETARRLKEAGCYCVRCAVECGNDEVRKRMLKREMSKQQIFNGTQLLHKYDIKFVLQNMLCLPDTNIKIDLETLMLNIKCKPTLAWSSIFQPYPGTELGDLFPQVTIDNINPSFYDNSVIDIPDKKLRIRLQKLFGVVVRYPILRYLLPLLLRLSLDNFYKTIWKWNNKLADRKLYGGII